MRMVPGHILKLCEMDRGKQPHNSRICYAGSQRQVLELVTG